VCVFVVVVVIFSSAYDIYHSMRDANLLSSNVHIHVPLVLLTQVCLFMNGWQYTYASLVAVVISYSAHDNYLSTCNANLLIQTASTCKH
jgi:hypothetical protein